MFDAEVAHVPPDRASGKSSQDRHERSRRHPRRRLPRRLHPFILREMSLDSFCDHSTPPQAGRWPDPTLDLSHQTMSADRPAARQPPEAEQRSSAIASPARADTCPISHRTGDKEPSAVPVPVSDPEAGDVDDEISRTRSTGEHADLTIGEHLNDAAVVEDLAALRPVDRGCTEGRR